MQFNIQFSVVQPNRPGMLSQLIEGIAIAKINLHALTIVDSHDQGVVRLVAENPSRIRTALETLNFGFTESKIIETEISNRPGALAKILSLLSDNKVNILYAYVTSGATGGKTTCVLKTNNLNKTLKLLEQEENKNKNRKPRKTGKRSR